MANEKMTKTEKYEAIRAILVEAGADEELVALCDHEVELIAAKAEKAKARAAEKKADGDELRATIESLLTDTPQTAEELLAQIDGEDLTKAKIVSRMGQLVKLGLASKGQIDSNGRKVMAYTLPIDAE